MKSVPTLTHRLTTTLDSLVKYVSVICAIISVCAGSGCVTSVKREEYRTIDVNASQDTRAAQELNAKALSFLNPCSDCMSCECHQAIKLLKSALEADMTYGPAHNNLGKAYFRHRRYYLAAWEFEHAIKLMPDRVEPIVNLGMVYEEVGKIEKAIEMYSIAHEMQPKAPMVIGNLARAMLRSEYPPEMVMGLLQDLLFYDTRPAWVCWAEEQLVAIQISLSQAATTESSNDGDGTEDVDDGFDEYSFPDHGDHDDPSMYPPPVEPIPAPQPEPEELWEQPMQDEPVQLEPAASNGPPVELNQGELIPTEPATPQPAPPQPAPPQAAPPQAAPPQAAPPQADPPQADPPQADPPAPHAAPVELLPGPAAPAARDQDNAAAVGLGVMHRSGSERVQTRPATFRDNQIKRRLPSSRYDSLKVSEGGIRDVGFIETRSGATAGFAPVEEGRLPSYIRGW